LAAITRELREELGVEVLDVGMELFAVNDPGSSFRSAFLPVAIRGEPTCHEHAAVRWMRLQDMGALPLAPSDRRFVESRLRHGAEDHHEREPLINELAEEG
jgi:8-oxo-dGTP diphosphatase